jgi:hypothetical protein
MYSGNGDLALQLNTAPRRIRSSRSGLSAGWVVVLCLLLLALLTAVQIGHVHLNENGASHCTLCQILQTAAPVSAPAALIFLVALGSRAPLTEQTVALRQHSSRRFIRPPPRSW